MADLEVPYLIVITSIFYLNNTKKADLLADPIALGSGEWPNIVAEFPETKSRS